MAKHSDWYSTTEVGKILKCNRQYITNMVIDNAINKYKVEKKKYLIHQSEVTRLLEESQYIDDNYYSRDEAAYRLSKSVHAVSNMIYLGIITSSVHYKNHVYCLKSEIESLATTDEPLNMEKDFIGLAVTKKYLNFNDGGVQYHFTRTKSPIPLKKINNKWYFEKNDFNDFINDIQNGFTLDEVADIWGISKTYALSILKVIKPYPLKNGEIKYRKNDIEKIDDKIRNGILHLPESEAFSSIECANILNRSEKVVQYHIRNGHISAKKVNGRYIILKSELDLFSTSIDKLKLLYLNGKNAYEYYQKSMAILGKQTVYKETMTLLIEWSNQKINNSRKNERNGLIFTLCSFVATLISTISKEIYLYCDDELIELNTNANFLKFNGLNFSHQFQKFCLKKRLCRFTLNGCKVTKKKRPQIKDIYPNREIVETLLSLTDTYSHITKAIDSRSYAQTWLFMILHLSLIWRRSTILNMPNASIEILGVDSFQWFDNNEVILEMGQKFMNDIKQKCSNIIANKNRQKVHFQSYFLIPTTVAYIICELHRRKINDSKIFSCSKYNGYYQKVLDKNISHFSSLKWNRTRGSKEYLNAVSSIDKDKIALLLFSFARSHKININGISETSKAYIVTTNADGDPQNKAFELFENGIGGWQIHTLIDSIYDTDMLSRNQMNQFITENNKLFSFSDIHNIAKFINTRYENVKALTIELMKYSKEELNGFLSDILHLQSPSLLDNCQCIIGIKNCKKNERSTSIRCLGCQFSVPLNYFLEYVNVKLFECIEILEDTPSTEMAGRIKYSSLIQKLLNILYEFHIVYSAYDKRYVNSFVNLNLLKDNLLKLETHGLVGDDISCIM